LARQSTGFDHGEKPLLSEEGIRPAGMIRPAEAHLPPLTPFSSAANMRSVQIEASTHSRASAS
jgi:hypothetical protein